MNLKECVYLIVTIEPNPPIRAPFSSIAAVPLISDRKYQFQTGSYFLS